MLTLFPFLKKNIHKIVAPYILAGVMYLVVQLGLPLPDTFATLLTDVVSTFLAATAVAGVGILQRLIAAKTNPDNTAK